MSYYERVLKRIREAKPEFITFRGKLDINCFVAVLSELTIIHDLETMTLNIEWRGVEIPLNSSERNDVLMQFKNILLKKIEANLSDL